VCKTYPDTITLNIVKQHLKLFFQNNTDWFVPSLILLGHLSRCIPSFRTPFYSKFISELFDCEDLATIERVLSRKDVEVWARG